MYVVEIEESMCVADVDRGVSTLSTILICNSSFLATAGKLQKVGTAVLGNNIKTLISGLWLMIQSVKQKVDHIYCFIISTVSCCFKPSGKLLETKYVDIYIVNCVVI